MKIKSILVSVLALFALVGTSFADDNYGPITIKQVNGKKVAYIDDDANVPLPEITNVTVDSVYFNRVFKQGIYSTLMLPFRVKSSVIAQGGGQWGSFTVGEFVRVSRDGCNPGENGNCPLNVYVRENHSAYIEPNTPYVVESNGGNHHIEFPPPYSEAMSVTINTTVNSRQTTDTYDGYKWDFIGTYEKIEFNKSTIKGVYGFAGEEKNGTKIGTFKKGVCKDDGCASVRAFRAYLKCSLANASQVKGLFKSNDVASLDDLPSTVDVHFITDKGTTYIGTLNTYTGEIVKEDRWFDMKGRRLMQKPTAKGTYYNNGKKVVIK